MKYPITVPSFQAVAAGQTATVDLPASGTYHSLLVNYGTATVGGANQVNTEAELDEFRLKVNGKVQREHSSAELDTINAFYGYGFATGYQNIMLAQPWRRTSAGEDAPAWGMGDVDTFQLEVDINAAAANPTLDLKVLWTPDNRPMGPIVKWRRFVVPVTAAGIVNVSTLPKGDAYYALHGFTGDILDVEIKIDQSEKWKLNRAEAAVLQSMYKRTQQAGVFTVDFDVTNRAADALSMIKPSGGRVDDFRIDFNMFAATSFTLLTETVGLRD